MLEPILADDVPGIVSLMNRAYRGSDAAESWNSEAAYIAGDRTTQALLRAELIAKPHGFFLKWVDPESGLLSGCVWLDPVADGIWYLGSLAIDPDRQNAGLGKTILFAAEEWVRDRGGGCVRMTVVNVREALIGWYVRRGYRVTGETEPFPYDDDRLGTPLRDDLMFVVLEKMVEPIGSQT